MSALAARRAAAANSSVSISDHQPDEIPASPATIKSKPRSIPRSGPVQTPQSDDSEDELHAILDTPNKRRKVDDSPPARPRYFAKAMTPPVASKRRQVKRFSPSAPVSESGEDSSDDELVDEAARRIDDEVEVEKVDWMALQGPEAGVNPVKNGRIVGKSNDKGRAVAFEPREGDNLVRLTSEDLRRAGLVDEIPGPGVLISLKASEDLTIAGAYNLTPLVNSVRLCSTSLSYSTTLTSHPIFAPTSHPLPVISSGAQSLNSTESNRLLSNLSLPKAFLANDNPRAPHSVFLIRELHTGISALSGGAVPGFNNIWLDEQGKWGLRGVHPVIGSFPTPVYPYITPPPPSWTTALGSLKPAKSATNGNTSYGDEPIDGQSPIIAIVKGPKRSGKSTLARAALNILLGEYERVAWLECDLGQGEFGCGGVVGIWIVDKPVIGPSFTHPRTPERAHYLGTYTPLTCPDEYIAAIQNLIEHYRYEVQYPSTSSNGLRRNDVVPLVVNTQGWVKGLGEDLLLGIERMVQPTHVFGFTSPTFDLPDETGGWTNSPPVSHTLLPDVYGNNHASSSHAVQRHFTLDPAPVSPLQARYTASDLRILSTMSYFHANLATSTVTWDFTRPLLSISPWEIRLGEGIEQVYLIGEGSDGVVTEDLHLALNGCVVALLEMVDGALLPEGGIYNQNCALPALEEANFLGLAFVRAVQEEKAGEGLKIRLITPLGPGVLKRANVMVKNGALEMPTCGLIDWVGGAGEEGMAGMGWGDIPFLEVRGDAGVGGDRRKYRRNVMRKGM